MLLVELGGDLGKCWFNAAFLSHTKLCPVYPLLESLLLFFIDASFHLPACACGAVSSIPAVNYALLLPQGTGQRITSHWEDRGLGTKVQGCRQCILYLHFVGFHWFLQHECAHVFMTTPCCSSVSLFHHTHRCLPASTGLMTVRCKDSLTPSSITHQYWWELSTLWASIPDLKFSGSVYRALGVYPRSVLQLWQEHKAKTGAVKVNCIRYTNLK